MRPWPISAVLFSLVDVFDPKDFQITWLFNVLTVSVSDESIPETGRVHLIKYLCFYLLHKSGTNFSIVEMKFDLGNRGDDVLLPLWKNRKLARYEIFNTLWRDQWAHFYSGSAEDAVHLYRSRNVARHQLWSTLGFSVFSFLTGR